MTEKLHGFINSIDNLIARSNEFIDKVKSTPHVFKLCAIVLCVMIMGLVCLMKRHDLITGLTIVFIFLPTIFFIGAYIKQYRDREKSSKTRLKSYLK